MHYSDISLITSLLFVTDSGMSGLKKNILVYVETAKHP